MKIEFDVEGRPPRKDGANSLWATGEAQRVLDLRLKILEIQKENDLVGPTDLPVKLSVIVFSPNIANRKNSQTYVGDLDSFIAGICECIQPAHPRANISNIFEKHTEIAPHIPLVVNDDAQVIEIVSKKRFDNHDHYSVILETMKN
jgi:Holliday junction resolvase RusA-like endonuclease